MLEALAAVSLVSAIVQFLDFSAKVVGRLREFQSDLQNVPKAFRDISSLLPLLIDGLTQMKEEADKDQLPSATQNALLPVIQGCLSQVELLNNILVKVLPTAGDSSWRRGKRAVRSVGYEAETAKIESALRGNFLILVQLSTFHRVIGLQKPETEPSKPVFMVPYERDSKFIGRENNIDELKLLFETQRRVALAGIGGVGKSQIAIEFCYKFRDDNPKAHVFWVYASTGARLEQAYQAIAKTLSIPDWNNAKVDAVQLVSDWLADEDNEQWLLVIDNADDTMMFFDSKSEAPRKGSEPPRAFARYIPNNPKGSVLITTRDKRLGERLTNRQKPLEVLPMTRFEARNLLYSKISDDECSDAELSELLSELAYLPLAITQAAAFISENNITVSEYLQALEAGEEDSKELLSEHLEDPRRDLDSENSVMRTWKLSFDQIMKEKPRAAEILSLMAVLDRQGIPKTLLRKEEDTETRFKTAVGTLQAFSLITVEKGKDAAFGMHRLVQLSTQKWLDLEGKTMYWRAQALEVLSNTFPVPTYDVWPTCEVLTPHVRIVLSHQFTTTKDLLRCSKLLNDTSHYARRIGRYAEGYEKSVKALEIRQRILPEDDPLIFESFHMVGMALFTQGEYHAAKEMLQRAKTGRERIFGKEDTDTAESMTSLARVLSEIGDLDGAEELHRQILKIREEDMGTENEYVLETLDHLATLMMNKGKLETAEEMYRRILSGRERLLGMHHPQTLESINNLAGVLHNQGRYNQAEELYMRALEGTERVLGTSHPATTLVHWNMALCQRLKGDLSSAEQSYRRALFGCQNTWGPDNPRTLECMVDLASVLEEKGAHGEAEELVLHASVKFKEGTTAGI